MKLHSCKRPLLHPYSMLTCNRAAKPYGHIYYIVNYFLSLSSLLSVILIQQDIDVDVTLSGVAKTRHNNSLLFLNFSYCLQKVGDAAERSNHTITNLFRPYLNQ